MQRESPSTVASADLPTVPDPLPYQQAYQGVREDVEHRDHEVGPGEAHLAVEELAHPEARECRQDGHEGRIPGPQGKSTHEGNAHGEDRRTWRHGEEEDRTRREGHQAQGEEQGGLEDTGIEPAPQAVEVPGRIEQDRREDSQGQPQSLES